MEATSFDISRLERLTKAVSDQVSEVSSQVSSVDSKVNSLQSELEALRNEFIEMTLKQQRNAVIQKATTELVRVRQEIQQKFGNYSVVRETMIGILQATDVALVKETTVSRVSEELMIATPRYWLAPCLVALAAWISNDRALAERAIAESMKRDIKKTAITMALICRRNGRTKTCFEWLDVYFQSVEPEKVTEADFAYVNAYASGVFGVDEDHICDEYITMWVNTITRGGEDFLESENTKWKEYCARFKTDISTDYDRLRNVPEFSRINDYVGRLEGVREVVKEFNFLNSAEIDIEKLREDIDDRLEKLINGVEEEEYELKDEEKFYQKTKLDGDEEKARREIEEEKRRREEETLNIIEQMSHIVRHSENTADRRTALRFVNVFANKGMQDFVSEVSMPETITIKQDGWEAKVNAQTNLDSVCQNYVQKMSQDCMAEKNQAGSQSNMGNIIAACGLGVLGLILMFAVTPVLGIAALAGAGYAGYKAYTFNGEMQKKLYDIDMKYQEAIQAGIQNIQNTGNQYRQVCYRVYEIQNGQHNAA